MTDTYRHGKGYEVQLALYFGGGVEYTTFEAKPKDSKKSEAKNQLFETDLLKDGGHNFSS